MLFSWSRNGRKLLSGSNDWNVSVWDVLSGECDQKYRFQSPVTKVQFHPRNKFVQLLNVYLIRIINLVLTKHEGHSGEYRHVVVVVQTKHQHTPVWLEQTRLVGSLLHGTLKQKNTCPG